MFCSKLIHGFNDLQNVVLKKFTLHSWVVASDWGGNYVGWEGFGSGMQLPN